MEFYYAGILILGCLVFWFFPSTLVCLSFRPPPELRHKRIILLIGHPDDEAMFFAPSLTALTSPQNHNEVRIVCLSTGNAVGEGEIRRGELLNSARRLGIHQDEDVIIVDDPRFQDGPGNNWRKEDIATFLSQKFTSEVKSNPITFSSSTAVRCSPQHTKQGKGEGEAASASSTEHPQTPIQPIHAIVTFDPSGISHHPNHCACYHGATEFLRKLTTTNNNNPHCPISLYTLTSIPLLRKYISVLDAPVSYILSRLTTTTAGRNAASERRDRIVFVSGFRDYARAFGAMVHAHKTQMLWFRWGWIIAGRYMVVNDLRRERVGC